MCTFNAFAFVRPLPRLMRLVVWFGVLSAVAAITPARSFASPAVGRKPVPVDSIVKVAIASVRSAYKSEYAAAAKSGDPRPLVNTLAQAARETRVDERKYALLEEAERMAIDAGLNNMALNVAKEKSLSFDVSVLPVRLKVLEKCSLSRSVDILEQGIALADTSIAIALNDADFPSAHAALKTMQVIIGAYGELEAKREKEVKKKYPRLFTKTKQPGPTNDGPTESDALPPKSPRSRPDYFTHRYRQRFDDLYRALEREIDIVEDRYEASRSSGPAGGVNEKAILQGEYLCFDQLDWDKGLPFLSKANGSLGDAAQSEITLGSSPSPAELMTVAGKWWEYSEGVSDGASTARSDVSAVQSHSASFYLRAAPQLEEAFDIRLAQKRITESPAPRKLQGVEADAAACDSASDAVQVYQMALASPTLPPIEKAAIESRLECWKARKAENYQRYGARWIARDERDEIESRADNLMRQALELLRLGKQAMAKAEFDAASAANEASAKAEFWIGLIYAIDADNDLLAVEHFQEAMRRDPGKSHILCALANCELLVGRCDDALRHYQAALENYAHQSIGNSLRYAVQHSEKLKISSELLDRYNALYRRATQELNIRPEGSYVSFPIPNAGDWDKKDKPKDSDNKSRYSDAPAVSTATGTGFVVAPGYIMTNHHVVEGCSEIVVVDPTKRERQYQAKVVASQKNPDLALLELVYAEKAEGPDKASDKGRLTAAPLVLAQKLSDRGEDIMALGFPGGALLGLELKSTKGAVISLGDPTFDGSFLHSCIINPGNSGGPIVNQYGELIGVVVAIVKTSSIGNAYSIGIPVEQVREFLDKHLPKTTSADNQQPATPAPETVATVESEQNSADDASEKPDEEKDSSETGKDEQDKSRPVLSWPKVDAKVSPSTVFIIGKTTE